MAKQVIQQSFGEPEVLEVVNLPPAESSELQADEIIVRVSSFGLNPVDWKTRRGGAVAGLMGDFPLTIGWDLAGTVEAVAGRTTEFKPGDRVFGMSRFPNAAGAYAQFAVASVNDLVALPENLSFDEGAALPLAALTAWQPLTEMWNLRPNQRVLVQGAGGGVGHLAVQMLRNAGAHVIGTGGPGKRDWLISLGVDEFIDYTTQDFVELLAHDPVDLALDFISDDVGVRSARVVKRGGLLLEFPHGISDEVQAAADIGGVRVGAPGVHLNKSQMIEIAKQAEAGLLVPTVRQVYSIDEIVEAHRTLEAGHVAGKLVVDPWATRQENGGRHVV